MCSVLWFGLLILYLYLDASSCLNLTSSAQLDLCNKRISIWQTKITDLNADCLLIIFENLNASELMTLAETNDYFKSLVANVFKRKFTTKSVLFSPSFPYKTSNYYNIDETDADLIVRNVDTFLKFLTFFGHSISCLSLAFGAVCSEKRIIKEAISLHCSKTLTQFNAYDTYDDNFDEFDRTFELVESVSLRGDFRNFDAFFRVFPFVHRLNFGSIRVVDLNVTAFERNLPNLKYLEIETSEYASDYLSESMAARLFQNNQQIECLTLKYATHNLLTHVADHLPLIENLTLFAYLDTSTDLEQTIHLDNILRLSVEFSDITMPKNVTFKNLIEYQFEIHTNPMKCTKWMEFVRSSDSLQIIRIDGRYLERNEFDRFAVISGNLVEIHVNCQSNVDVDTVVGLVKNSQKLEKIHLTLPFDDEAVFQLITDALRVKLASDWIFSVNSVDIFIENFS